MEAGDQHCLIVGPGGALARELGQEGGFRLFRLLLRLRKQLILLYQLRGQQIAQCGLGFTQLLLKNNVGF